MSVSVSTTLPSVPTGGGLKFVPLGGDGYRAPMSAYAVSNVVAGDVSGGQLTVEVKPDPQYVSIASYVQLGAFGTGAALEATFEIANGDETVSFGATLQDVGPGGINSDNSGLWSPPLLLLDPPAGDPTIRIVIANPGAAVTITSSLRLYNFRKGVQQRTPLDVLVAAFPRASTFIG